MSTFLYGIILQWKLDLRNKGVLLTYYIVPLVFFALMGGIFSTTNPASKETLIQSMTVFGVTMGAILGAPTPLVELYSSEIRKAYKVGGIPLWTPAGNNFISAFIHLLLMSLVILFVAPLVFDAKPPDIFATYFLSLAIFIAVSLAIGTVLGLYIKSASKLTMAAQFIFLPSIMLGGIMFPADMLPGALQTISMILPATWGFKLMSENSFDITNLLPLIIIIAAAACAAVFKLRRVGME